MIRRRFGLLSIPSSFPHAFSSFHSSHTKHYSAFLSLTLPPSFSVLSHSSQISAPCLPLTLMPPSLSLPSSAPPPPVLHSTSLHSGFAPSIMSFLQLPLSLLTLILPSPPLPLLLSTTPTAESSTARYWQWRILSLGLTLSIHPPYSHTHASNTIEMIWGAVSGPKNIQLTGLWWHFIWINLCSCFSSWVCAAGWFLPFSHMYTHTHHGSDSTLSIIISCVLFLMHTINVSYYVLANTNLSTH